MEKLWRIIREDSFKPVPGSPKIPKDIALAIEPVPNDVLILDRPDDNLKGEFLVVRRIIDGDDATVVVRPFEQ